MQIGVAYSESSQQIWMIIEVPEGATVAAAIEKSGILRMFPTIDLSVQKVGIFGRLVNNDASLKPGDRIEIYRPIVCDPRTVPRRDSMESEDE